MAQKASPPLEHRESSAVRVFTLGRFSFEVDGRTVRFGGKQPRKPLVLLKTLVALGGDGVSVEQLCDSLWPDLEGDKAYNSFKSALSRLRKLIGHQAVIHEGGRLTIASETCWADALEFDDLLAESSRVLDGKRTEEALRYLDKALALYRGPFLNGEFEPAEILTTRERLHGHFLRHVTLVGDVLLQGGQPQKAIRLYQQGLEIDDVSEDICLLLMNCLSQQGRIGEAIATFRLLQQALQTRIGIQPSPQCEALYRNLLALDKRQPGPPEDAQYPPAEPTQIPVPAAASLPPANEPAETPPEGERRQVTAPVFTLSGLTSLGEDGDPEEWEQTIRRLREEVQRAVEDNGGLVNQFLRDEVVAIFGIPAAHEDDPQRAVRAALTVRMALAEFKGHPGGAGKASLSVGTEIDTGAWWWSSPESRGVGSMQ